MFHPGPASEGILILPPFGHEALSSAKTLRLLAETLSSRGYPVLRIDFPGTGDSLGEEDCAGVVASRLTAALEAANWLRNIAGVEKLSVVGVRLGASTALNLAEAFAVHRLLLVAPVLSGRRYLRELQQMRAHYAIGGEAEGQAENEFNGFSLSETSLAQLRALDVRKPASGHWHKAAVMSQAGPGAAQDLVDLWQASGRAGELIPHCALADVLTDPVLADHPQAFLQTVSDWFGNAGDVSGPTFLPNPMRLCGDTFVETAWRFGKDGALFGILCQPLTGASAGPALVLANTGANPRSGWGRQTTELARALASEGYTTFRIDLADIGESPALEGRPERVVYIEETGEDVLAAVRHLESLGFERPAIAGICSGAYAAFHAARQGADISGALMINLQKFYWREGDSLVLYKSVNSYFEKLFSRAAWQRIFSGEANLRGVAKMLIVRVAGLLQARFAGLIGKFKARGETGEVRKEDVRSPRADIEAMLTRGVLVSMQFTRGDGGIDEMRGHLGTVGASVRNKGAFDYAVIAGADHNFSTAASRAKLLPVARTFLEKLNAR